MNLGEAMALKKRMEDVIAPIEAALISSSEQYKDWYMSSIPRDFYVVTKDGESFGVMYFEGAYSSYREAVVWNPEVLDNPNEHWQWSLEQCQAITAP